MAYIIRVMYGNKAPATAKFMFETENNIDSDIMFDKAVKDINSIYKSKGRFDTSEEVIEHFSKYGFYRIAL